MTKEQWKVAVLAFAEACREEEQERTKMRLECEAIDAQMDALNKRRMELEAHPKFRPWSAGQSVTDLLGVVCRGEIEE